MPAQEHARLFHAHPLQHLHHARNAFIHVVLEAVVGQLRGNITGIEGYDSNIVTVHGNFLCQGDSQDP